MMTGVAVALLVGACGLGADASSIGAVAAERQLYSQDIQATRGLIELLAGGSAALQPDSKGITFAFQFNPRPTDPQTFTIAGYDASVPVKQAFATSINSEWYPNPQAGA